MGELSEDWKRGWNACLRGEILSLNIHTNRVFVDGYLACMDAHSKGDVKVLAQTNDAIVSTKIDVS